MIKLFVASEAFFFLLLIVAYVHFWQAAHFRIEAINHLNAGKSAVFTALLLASSFTFYCAERSFTRGSRRTKIWLATTAVLGIIFLSGQGLEYYKLLHENVTISKDEFGSSFFTLTGFHGLHVMIGLVWMLILCGLLMAGVQLEKNSDLLATAGIYWHFVDAVWLILFTLIYIMPHFLPL